MENLFIDTNIVIDLLAKRVPFYQSAQRLFSLAIDSKEVRLHVSVLTFANTCYLLSKHYNGIETRKILSKFKGLVNVLTFDDKILNFALASDFNDFEDAIQYYTALENYMDSIITRNEKDFKASLLPVMTAEAYLEKNIA
jgi:predicted nucleic acid-binding protein